MHPTCLWEVFVSENKHRKPAVAKPAKSAKEKSKKTAGKVKASAPELGRRRADVKAEPASASRRDVIRRSQFAAYLLFAFYIASTLLVSSGIFFGFGLLSEGLDGGAVNDDGSDTIAGILIIAFDLFLVGLFAYLTRRFWVAIRSRNVHRIRHFSFISLLGSIAGLLVLLITSGTSVLAATGPGGAAVFLLLFAFVALSSYAANRSLSEQF